METIFFFCGHGMHHDFEMLRLLTTGLCSNPISRLSLVEVLHVYIVLTKKNYYIWESLKNFSSQASLQMSHVKRVWSKSGIVPEAEKKEIELTQSDSGKNPEGAPSETSQQLVSF